MTTSASERPGCFARILSIFGRSERNTTSATYDYRLVESVLTKAEISFYHVLRQVAPATTVVMTKVGLKDIFDVPKGATSPQTQRNKIDRKHIDFLLCDMHTMKPLLGIELDDSSHNRADRVERDVFVEQVFRTASLPLLRFPAKQGYQPAQIAEQLQRIVGGTSQSAPTPQPIRATQTPPACPTCGSPMVLRTTRAGANAGQQFYGCSNYPQCRGVISLTKP